MLAVPDDRLTTDDDVVNVGRCGGEPDLLRTGACSAHRVEADYDEVRGSPIGYPTTFRPAQAAVPRFTGDHDQIVESETAAFARSQSLVQLESTHFLERIDRGLFIRAGGGGAASLGPMARRTTV